MELPIHGCGYKVSSVDQAGLSPHTHTVSSEIIQTFNDEGNILINGTLYPMQKNGLYFIHGLATHFVLPEDINRYYHSIIRLNTPEIEQLCARFHIDALYRGVFTKTGGTFCALSPEMAIEADRLFLKAHQALKEPGPLLQAKLFSVFVDLLEMGSQEYAAPPRADEKISDILNFISDHALSKLSMDDICAHTHVSKYHLCRIFKEHMGVTIGSFIRSRRLSIAKQLLATTDMSVTAISAHCCFTDASFFSKTFTKEFGMTPSSFRAKYR